MTKTTKKGIILNFQEEPSSIAATLLAYIKKSPGKRGKKEEQENLIEKLISLAGIDKTVWKIKSFKITPNIWGVTMKQKKFAAKSDSLGETKTGLPMKDYIAASESWAEQGFNYQLKVEIYFERINPADIDMLASFKELIKELPTIVLPEIMPTKEPSGIAAELAIYDPHFGKLAWKDETGYRHYDTKIASADYSYVIDNGLNLIEPHKPEKIFYVVGQDLYHVDNMASHTTGGDHTLDVDGRITKVHKTVFVNVRDAIYKASKIAPVEVIWIPGNHDYLTSYMLVFALQEHFRDSGRVTFDIGENQRKARLWGNLLVGWTHRIVSKHTVWSNELAQAFPELWGRSVFREWHHGDQHKKQNTKVTPLATSGGVICRQITALSPVDQWHTANVFTDAVPGGELFLWSRTKGVYGNFTIWTGQYDTHRNNIIKK